MIDELMRDIRGADVADMLFLVAGPVEMVSAVRGAIAALGVPDAHIQTELHA
jgi:ferredoxin-NADP reductase